MLKKQVRLHLLLIFTTIVSSNCFAQKGFEKGYYINNNDERISCLIENTNWKNNPTQFKYKVSENSEILITTTELVKAFGIDDYSKYIRSTIAINRKNELLEQLSADEKSISNKKIVFLKAQITGKANLFKYKKGNLLLFYYQKEGNEALIPLTSKNVNIEESKIDFKQQLFEDLNCQGSDLTSFNSAVYTQEYLSEIIIAYNQCSNSETTNYIEKQKKDLFSLNVRAGLTSSSLYVKSTIAGSSDINFDTDFGYRISAEAEFILPYSENKWAIIVEPTFQTFKTETTAPASISKLDYKSLELPIGIRHYFFLSKRSKLFVNGSYILEFPFNATVLYDSGRQLDITKSVNLAFGIGYKFNNTYGIEFRYHTLRAQYNSYQSYGSDFKSIAVILGYSIK